MVVTITRDGFIKRTPLETFRAQNRGGRGRTGAGRVATTSSPAASTPTPISGCCSSRSGKSVPREGVAAAGNPTECERPGAGQPAARTWRRYRHHRAAAAADETLWDSLHLVFGTSLGNVRRNRLSDFRNVRSTGLIAMKLDEGDHLIGVPPAAKATTCCWPRATAAASASSFPTTPCVSSRAAIQPACAHQTVRQGRGDQPVLLRHVDATIEEREPICASPTPKRRAKWQRQWRCRKPRPCRKTRVPMGHIRQRGAGIPSARQRGIGGRSRARCGKAGGARSGGRGCCSPSPTWASARRSSAYEYRVTGRGGQGIANITLAPRNGTAVVATLPVRSGDDVMMVTDAGRLIRVPAEPGAHHRTAGRWA